MVRVLLTSFMLCAALVASLAFPYAQEDPATEATTAAAEATTAAPDASATTAAPSGSNNNNQGNNLNCTFINEQCNTNNNNFQQGAQQGAQQSQNQFNQTNGGMVTPAPQFNPNQAQNNNVTNQWCTTNMQLCQMNQFNQINQGPITIINTNQTNNYPNAGMMTPPPQFNQTNINAGMMTPPPQFNQTFNPGQINQFNGTGPIYFPGGK